MRAVQLVVLALGAGLGVFYSFLGVMLDDRGFTATQIGITIALAGVAFTVAVPFWGHVADVKLGRGRALVVCGLGAAAGTLVLVGSLPALAIAAGIIVFSFFQSAWQPLADALTINALGDRRRDYGRIRVLTSLSFALGTILAGQVYGATGYWPAPLLFSACAVVMAFGALRAPDVARATLSREPASSNEEAIVRPGRRPRRTWRFGSTGEALRLAPRLGIVMLAVGLAHVGILGGFTFLPLRVVELGGSPTDIALMAGLSAAVEIPAMLGAAAVAQRIGLRGVCVGSVLLYGLAIASWTQVDGIEMLVAIRATVGVAYAGLVVSIVLTIGALLPPTLQATGQALYQTVAFGVSAVVANTLGGL